MIFDPKKLAAKADLRRRSRSKKKKGPARRLQAPQAPQARPSRSQSPPVSRAAVPRAVRRIAPTARRIAPTRGVPAPGSTVATGRRLSSGAPLPQVPGMASVQAFWKSFRAKKPPGAGSVESEADIVQDQAPLPATVEEEALEILPAAGTSDGPALEPVEEEALEILPAAGASDSPALEPTDASVLESFETPTLEPGPQSPAEESGGAPGAIESAGTLASGKDAGASDGKPPSSMKALLIAAVVAAAGVAGYAIWNRDESGLGIWNAVKGKE
jgi:hypothetical protein